MKKEEKRVREWLSQSIHWGQKVYHFRCDVMPEPQRQRFQALQAQLRQWKKTWKKNLPMPVGLEGALEEMESQLQAFGKPFYHNKAFSFARFWGENAEVIWVAMFAALTLRTFFFQPFRIPTCSMFPSYSGMLTQLREDWQPKVPAWKAPFRWITTGAMNYHYVAPCDGRVSIPIFTQKEARRMGSLFRYEKQKGIECFSHWFSWLPLQERRVYTLYVGNQPVRVLVPGEFTDMDALLRKKFFPQYERTADLFEAFEELEFVPQRGMCLRTQTWVTRGQPFLHFDILDGDMVFVDRFSYHFRQPKIGEAVVFRTEHIPQLGRNTYYIKRLVGKEGDRLSMQGSWLFRNGKKVTGHPVFEANGQQKGLYAGYLAKGSFEGGKEVTVPQKHWFVLGDHSPYSYDSRYWGCVPQKEVIGKAFFILHPFSWRWGRTQRANPNVDADRKDFVFD
ncbi:MAG: signal peptidase I [Opitutales bacterium]|nr:signal peptidase I [Opitutales bacterium]